MILSNYKKTKMLFGALSPILLLITMNTHAAEQVYEENMVINLAETYGKESLTLPHYQLDPIVINDGRMSTYQVSSGINNYKIYGDQLLLERLHEIEAIVALREIKDSEAYSRGLENAANVPLTLTRNTIEDPIGTLEAIPDGISNLLDDLGAALGSVGKNKKSEDNAMLKNLLGFNTVKRRLASELSVDPYSSNKALQTELDDVAWSMFAGGATIDAMMAAAPMAASVGMHVADRTNREQTDWKIPPATLIQAAEQAVIKIGLSQAEATRLLYHPVCSVNHLGTMVVAMIEIKGASGRDDFLRAASNAQHENECRNYRTLAKLLHHYHKTNKPLQQLQTINNTAIAVDNESNQIITIDADFFLWNQANAKLIADSTRDNKKYLLLSGSASLKTKENAEKLGINIIENTLKTSNTTIDTVKVLLPNRVPDPIAAKENKTGKVIDDITTGIGNTIGGILGGLAAPQDNAEASQVE